MAAGVPPCPGADTGTTLGVSARNTETDSAWTILAMWLGRSDMVQHKSVAVVLDEGSETDRHLADGCIDNKNVPQTPGGHPIGTPEAASPRGLPA